MRREVKEEREEKQSTAVEIVRDMQGESETEVEQRLCDVRRTLLSDPAGLRRADGCYVRCAIQTLWWFGLKLIS